MNRKVQRSYILENETMTSTTPSSRRTVKCKCGKQFAFGSLIIIHIEQGKCDLFPPSWAIPALQEAIDALFARKRKEIREAKKGLRMDNEDASGYSIAPQYGAMTPGSLRLAKLEQEMSFYHAFNDQNSALWRPIPGRGAVRGTDKNEATEKCLSTIPEYMGRQQVMKREVAVNTSNNHDPSFLLDHKMPLPNLEAIWAHAHDPSMSPSSVTGPNAKRESDEAFQKKRQHSIARTSTMLFAGHHGSLPASMTKGSNKLSDSLPFNSSATITTITSPASTGKTNQTNYYNTFPRMVKFGNGDRSFSSINSKDAEMLSTNRPSKTSSAPLRPSTPMHLPPPARPPPPIPSYLTQRPHSSPQNFNHVHTSLPTPPPSRHSKEPPMTQFLLFPSLRKKEPLRSPIGTRVSPTKEEMLAGGLFKGDRGFFIDGENNGKKERKNFKWRWKKKGMKDDEQEAGKEEELEKMLDSWVLLDPRR